MTDRVTTVVLVRADSESPERNHREDEALAVEVSKSPPCTVMLIGGMRERRKQRTCDLLEVGDITARGVSVYAPEEVCSPGRAAGDEDLANALAAYLADKGLRTASHGHDRVVVRVAASFPSALLAAVVEAVSVHSDAAVRVGDTTLESHLRWQLRRDRFRAPRSRVDGDGLLGDSKGIRNVRDAARRYAEHPYPVLIVGETGTGKELVAALLHKASGREGRFMPTNAAELQPQLAESLLFGHAKGAFTGADKDRSGRIRETDGGTFFLDEVFNLDPLVQGKLLRALNRTDEGIIEVEPVGTSQKILVSCRMVSAAQSDPRLGSTSAGTSAMREDLFYRLAAGIIRIPPLRERSEDLEAIAVGLLKKLNRRVSLGAGCVDALADHRWPGNVRELRLVLLRALMDGAPDQTLLTPDRLRSAINALAVPSTPASLPLPCRLNRELLRIKVATMRAAAELKPGNLSAAGKHVGMSPKDAKNFGARLATAEKQLRELEGDASEDEGT